MLRSREGRVDGVPGREENVDEDDDSRVAMMKSCGATRNQLLIHWQIFYIDRPSEHHW